MTSTSYESFEAPFLNLVDTIIAVTPESLRDHLEETRKPPQPKPRKKRAAPRKERIQNSIAHLLD